MLPQGGCVGDGMADDPTTWVQQLWDVLCKMYRAWGGDCRDLGPNPSDWVNADEGAYGTKGAPEFPGSAAKQAFLELLTTLETLLDEPDNTLGPTDTSRLL